MPNEKDWEEKLIYGKKQELTKGKVTRGEVVGDRTIINLKAFSKEYKLVTWFVLGVTQKNSFKFHQ